ACSRILENLLLLILRVNRSMAESGVLTVADPPLWSVILMIAAVFILFLPKYGWWKIPVACGIILLPLYWHLRTIQAESELLVLYGADDGDLRKISFVLTEPARRGSVILNLPDWSSAADADTFLKSRGIRKCRLFLAADHYAGSVAGADPFAERAELTEAVLFSRQMGKCTGDYPRKERKDRFFSGKDLKIQSERGNFNAVFPEYGITLDVQRQKDGLLILRINGEEWRIAPTLQRHFRIFRIGKNRIETIQER
ncbi:MAG: hypothetical protein J6Q65_01970, partial [Lentisphaeria bacterium]|nr:hypothetical protein [Lentisphaeria bacterium]